MKEANDMGEALVVKNNEITELNSEEDHLSLKDVNKETDLLISNEGAEEPVSSLPENETPEAGLCTSELNSQDVKDDCETNSQILILDCKTEADLSPEGPEKKKPKITKTDENCAINEEVIPLPFNEMSVDNETDANCKLGSDVDATEDAINEIDLNNGLAEIKSEPVDCISNSGVSTENDAGSCENMSLTKSPDENSYKSKDNSESDTRVSSASENSLEVPKKRKRRRDNHKWSTVKRRSRMRSDNSTVLNQNGESKNTSPISNETYINGKRRFMDGSDSQKKNREFAVPSPSLADINVKAATPESTATSHEGSKPMCFCQKKPQVFISGNNNTGDLYCQALDCIDNRIVGCCNPIPSQDVGLYRASEKAPYQMMCEVHQQRLCRHNCCPGCGLFCTQGRYFMCRLLHHFHKTCGIENNRGLIFCPHCGDDSPPKSVVVSIHSVKHPVFLPNQKPIRNTKSAKISITKGGIQVLEEEEEKEKDPDFQFPTLTLTAAGNDVSVGNGLLPTLHRDKLANLLNIACRSFSDLCCSNRYSHKSLYNACMNGDVEKLIKIIASGFNPNFVFEENNKQTPLHVAAASGHLSVIHILLQAKAQIDVLDGELNTPLTTAILAKHNDVVKYLIKCGASLVLKSEDGMTPLHLAAKSGNSTACVYILNGTNLPPKYIDTLDDGGWTPMVWASEFNHLDIVKFLISKGSDPFIKDAEQNVALHWAAFGGSIDIVELFLNDGSDINAVNVHGDTPLHIAARQDNYSCVLLLLARGAKSDVKNKNDELPRDCCESPLSDIYKAITLNMEIGALLTRFQERTPKIISNDISQGKERNQIQCVNAVDDEEEPRDYIYVSESCFTSKITVDRTINSLQSCKCRNNCSSDGCNCATISIKCWYDIDGKLKPDFNYLDPPMIFECNQACLCNRITCRNRVVQNGISCRFQLFRTESRGWGIKTLNLIPKGTYVCEYVGEIISDCEADHREDDSYLFDLDNRDGETYCIDARHYGNFARFINHMCVPNVMPVHVFVDHQDLRFPRIAFFANRDILPNEELGYNYGEKFWVIKWKSFTCTCGSEKCMYSENTIQTTLENYRKKIEENP